MQAQLAGLETQQADPDFWNDQEAAKKILRKVQSLKQWTVPLEHSMEKVEELSLMAEMVQEEDDPDARADLAGGVGELEQEVAKLDFQFLLSGEEDERGAVVEIHPGAGGTESQDWAQMLLRMYTRYFERHGMKASTLDLQAGDEAGIKSAVLEIDHPFAFGYLKSESGVHRLVRISPFDSQSRRHTSFASVFVYPLVDDDVEVEIDPGDLRIDTYRAQGAGGQHVNKTDSAIRITHEPTGVVAQCQSERSQHRNRESAMTMLRAKLYHRIMEERQRERDAIEADKMEIAWGSQIRSYVLQPYTKVKDHRTDHETGNASAVLDGDLDDFIDAYLRWNGSRAK
jgi:peptide chain release factor 2